MSASFAFDEIGLGFLVFAGLCQHSSVGNGSVRAWCSARSQCTSDSDVDNKLCPVAERKKGEQLPPLSFFEGTCTFMSHVAGHKFVRLAPPVVSTSRTDDMRLCVFRRCRSGGSPMVDTDPPCLSPPRCASSTHFCRSQWSLFRFMWFLRSSRTHFLSASSTLSWLATLGCFSSSSDQLINVSHLLLTWVDYHPLSCCSLLIHCNSCSLSCCSCCCCSSSVVLPLRADFCFITPMLTLCLSPFACVPTITMLHDSATRIKSATLLPNLGLLLLLCLFPVGRSRYLLRTASEVPLAKKKGSGAPKEKVWFYERSLQIVLFSGWEGGGGEGSDPNVAKNRF